MGFVCVPWASLGIMLKEAEGFREKEGKMFAMQRAQQLRLLGFCSVIIACHTGTSFLEETLFKHLQYKSPFVMVLVMCVLYRWCIM